MVWWVAGRTQLIELYLAESNVLLCVISSVLYNNKLYCSRAALVSTMFNTLLDWHVSIWHVHLRCVKQTTVYLNRYAYVLCSIDLIWLNIFHNRTIFSAYYCISRNIQAYFTYNINHFWPCACLEDYLSFLIPKISVLYWTKEKYTYDQNNKNI